MLHTLDGEHGPFGDLDEVPATCNLDMPRFVWSNGFCGELAGVAGTAAQRHLNRNGNRYDMGQGLEHRLEREAARARWGDTGRVG